MCRIISELGRTGASWESSAHELDCHEECWEFEDLGPGDKEREGSDRQEVKGQPVFDLQEQGGIRRPAESALGENSHVQTLSGGLIRGVQPVPRLTWWAVAWLVHRPEGTWGATSWWRWLGHLQAGEGVSEGLTTTTSLSTLAWGLLVVRHTDQSSNFTGRRYWAWTSA